MKEETTKKPINKLLKGLVIKWISIPLIVISVLYGKLDIYILPIVISLVVFMVIGVSIQLQGIIDNSKNKKEETKCLSG